jgi:archaellum biogenesis ATPase FlaH
VARLSVNETAHQAKMKLGSVMKSEKWRSKQVAIITSLALIISMGVKWHGA